MIEAGPALALTGVSKHFGGLQALNRVDFVVNQGEIHALLGQNGSGKSTLVKIITGVHAPDAGARLELWGKPAELPMAAAHRHGIAVIHQDLGLVDRMTVVENLGITSGYGTRTLLPIARRRERERCTKLLADIGLDVALDALVASLSPAVRAGIAIARATRLLQDHAQQFLFILDEPTAYLSSEGSERVMSLMRAVSNSGSSVIFISHRLPEVLSVAHRITVLRDGQVADTFKASDGDHRRIISAMLGRSLEQYYPDRTEAPVARPLLQVTGLTGNRLHGASFSVSPGEIVGFAGLVGMGHEEIPYLLGGNSKSRSGRAELAGRDVLDLPLGKRIQLGMVLVPGNRQRDGAWLAATAQENIALPTHLRQPASFPLRLGRERRYALSQMSLFGVTPPLPDRKVSMFSGGNQQKIVLAKWMSMAPRVLLLDEPTQGVDAGAKYEVLRILVDAAKAGSAVLIFSGDYEQLAHVCHRVLVLSHGHVVAELVGGDITESAIAHAAQGEWSHSGLPDATRLDGGGLVTGSEIN
ncbi:MAG: sugar ABC transporter ATP-binding protein [Candidatus Dormibacteraceae bacterium]